MKIPSSPRHKALLSAAALGGVLLLGTSGPISIGSAARFLFVAALLAAGAFLYKKRAASSDAEALPRLRVLSRTGLSQRCGLALVEADGRTVLVAFGDGFAQLLQNEAPPSACRTRKAVRS